jgi:acetyltransferase-like isoleucine patch superfamily enzyme
MKIWREIMDCQYNYTLLDSVGNNVYISSNVRIRRPELFSMGSHIAIDWGFYCTAQVSLGDYIHIGPHVSCIGGKDGILKCAGFNNIMAGSRIICVSESFDNSGLFGSMIPDEYRGRLINAPVIMEPFSNVGTNAVVLPGSYLAMGVLITVGSVIRGKTEPWTVYSGNPAKPVRQMDGRKAIENAKKMGYFYDNLEGS